MRSTVVGLVGSLILGLVSSSPALALFDPQISAGGRVNVGDALGANFGPGGGTLSFSSDVDGPIDTATLDIDQYLVTSTAQAGYGVLGAAASAEFSGASRRFSGGLVSASAAADFTDNVTFDAASFTGQSGFAEMTITLSGTASATAGDNVFSSSGGRLRMTIGGETVSIGSAVDTAGNTIDNALTQTLLFEIIFGEAMELDGSLDANVYSNATASPTLGGSGSAGALFANTGGVNGFKVFDRSMNPVDFEFSTQSGEFEFYPTVPEPSTALLMGLGLTLMASHRRRAGA